MKALAVVSYAEPVMDYSESSKGKVKAVQAELNAVVRGEGEKVNKSFSSGPPFLQIKIVADTPEAIGMLTSGSILKVTFEKADK